MGKGEGYPIQSWMGGGYPIQAQQRGTWSSLGRGMPPSSPGWGGTPGYPWPGTWTAWGYLGYPLSWPGTWPGCGGTPGYLSPDLGWGTSTQIWDGIPMSRPLPGYPPPSRPGNGVPPILTWDGVTPPSQQVWTDLKNTFPHRSDAGGNEHAKALHLLDSSLC